MILRVDELEDSFLHLYENHSGASQLSWVNAKILEFKNSTGNSPPWHLSPRLIPRPRIETVKLAAINKIQSVVDQADWEGTLLGGSEPVGAVYLPSGTTHQLELEVSHHITAFIRVRFTRPSAGGGEVRVTYSESYEDRPDGDRRMKKHRQDLNKSLIGPQDIYHFQGSEGHLLGYRENETTEEILEPYHFRTFRFLKLDITVGPADLFFNGIDIETINYPLEVVASLKTPVGSSEVEQLWETSIRTLVNCMHDCYEDCPFYEQLQYAMDTRSSALFTYCVSGDDRLARQAIIQIHNSYQPRLGLTASRAPTHRQQFIPSFSLYWICMLEDHLDFFGDKTFLPQFLPVIDGVLSYFHSRLDPELGLVKSDMKPGIWNFVDWTQEWKPHGLPPACQSTGYFTYINELYVYTLKRASRVMDASGRPAIAAEYLGRADSLVEALRKNCFDGEFFTDSLATASSATDYSQHCQIWAVLSGTVSVGEAQGLLRKSLEKTRASIFVQESVSMTFYTLRALSIAGLYDEQFNNFWEPWREQLRLGVTTWAEDLLNQRSDCHAWGSAPIYEFVIEVVGIRPVDGWTALEFKPRITLYRDFEAKVPLKMVKGKHIGICYVSWTTLRSGDIEVRLRLHMDEPRDIEIRVRLPGQKIQLNGRSHDLRFIVEDARNSSLELDRPNLTDVSHK